MVKSTGISTNTASIMDYVRFVKEACLLFTLDNFASKFAEKETAKKHYFIDNGLLSVFLTDQDTSLLENLCAIALYRKYSNSSTPQLYYYNKQIEVDFYIPKKGIGIQACYHLNDHETYERETHALVALHKAYGLQQALIISYDEEMVIERDGLQINVSPIWKWLLKL